MAAGPRLKDLEESFLSVAISCLEVVGENPFELFFTLINDQYPCRHSCRRFHEETYQRK